MDCVRAHASKFDWKYLVVNAYFSALRMHYYHNEAESEDNNPTIHSVPSMPYIPL